MRGRAQPCDQNTGQTRGKLLYWVPNRAWAFRVALVIKNLSATAGDARVAGSTPGSERSPGVGNGNPLQYSWLENSMDGSLEVYTPWSCKESDMTERLNT